LVSADRKIRLPLACGIAASLALLALIPHRIAGGGYLTHVSGSWAALADDVAHGVLYRPLLSKLGYGGTRYFPLHIVLHGLIARAGLSLRAAGHLLSLVSAGALVVGGALGLSLRGAPAGIAWPVGVLALASRTAFMSVAGIRGDLLPVALGVLGLAFTPRNRGDSFIPASVLLAKPTLVWAPAGALLALAASSHWRIAMKMGALVTLVIAGGLLAALWASHGEMLVSFRACASGGGLSLSTLVTGLSFVRPGELTWIVAGIGMTLWRGRNGLMNPLTAAGLVCLPVTLVVFMSRGTHVNHFIDLTAMGALAVGAGLADHKMRLSWARIALVVATALGISEAALLDGIHSRPGELEQAADALPSGSDPVLSEQPWIPLLAGERAFMIDSYSLLLTRQSSPAVDDDLLRSLDQCRFRAVVLLGRPEKESTWYDTVQFGTGFRQHLSESYALTRIAGAYAIYTPRCGSPDTAATPESIGGETSLDRGAQPSFVRAALERVWPKRR
jgi:hypothetical protein